MCKISRIQLMKLICASNNIGDTKTADDLEKLYTDFLDTKPGIDFFEAFFELPPTLQTRATQIVNEYTKKQERLIASII